MNGSYRLQDKANNEMVLFEESVSNEKKAQAQEQIVQNWNERQAQVPSMFNIEIKQDGDQTVVSILKPAEHKAKDDKMVPKAALSAMTGSAGNEYASHLFSLTLSATIDTSDVNVMSRIANAHKEALLALRPADEIEGQLITRMVALHDQYMKCLSKACNSNQTTKGVQMYVNLATKLMRVHNETLNTLNTYRRKATQKMIVQHQHINVGQGGKAAVGNFHPGGGNV